MSKYARNPWTAMTNILVMVLAVFVLVAGPAPNKAVAQAETLTPTQRLAVEDAVGDFLRNNPEIVIEAINILRQREQAAETADARNVIAARGSELFNDPATPTNICA